MHRLHPLTKRIRNYYNKASWIKRIAILGGALLTFFLISLIGLFLLVWSGVFGRIPGSDELSKISHPVPSEVYSADSVLIGRYAIQERSLIDFEELPSYVVDALVATEDARFFKHSGIDLRSIFRVLFKTLLFGDESSGGGSTITQQLAKNLFPRKSYRFISLPINKIREMIIASRLERLYTKEELLALYLNTVPFGDNTYGVESAAERFFSVPVSDLSIGQTAVLIGMLKANYYYNPRIFPESAEQRKNVVIQQMVKYNYIDQAHADSISKTSVHLKLTPISNHSGLAPYFREYIKGELLRWCENHHKANGEPYNLFTDGLKIYTTIDSRLQAYAEESVATVMRSLQKEFNNHWRNRNPWERHPTVFEQAVYNSERYKSLNDQGFSRDSILKEMAIPLPMTVLFWDGEKEVTMSPLDSIAHYLKFLQAGLLAMTPQTGAIKAWVGGINHQYFEYDHVKETTKRQVGSTFKPIVYAAALEQGIDPCSYVSAGKVMYTNMEGWLPENDHSENYDRKYSMAGALTYSVNTVSVRVAEQAGLSHAVDLAKDMGIHSHVPEVPSIALGTPAISMMEMVSAYACFVNEGRKVTPYYILSITDNNNHELEVYKKPVSNQVMSKETSQLIIEMLKGVVNEGTGSSLRTRYNIVGDLAGKTGTTQSNADGWFLAMTPELVVGSWVGADNPAIRFRTTALGQGAHTALPIFANFYKKIYEDKERRAILTKHFPTPEKKILEKIDCDLYKSDLNFAQRIFGSKKDKVKEREFGSEPEEKKEGFFKRLFKKRG